MPNIFKAITHASGILDLLFKPVRLVLAGILPKYTKDQLNDPKLRDEIVDLADAALVKEYPAAQLVSESARKHLIRQVLDMLLNPLLH